MTESSLRATTLPLESGPPIDPFFLAGPDGIIMATEELVLVGVGAAVSIALPDGLQDGESVAAVRDRLAAIVTDDRVGRPGSGVLAFGALPFSQHVPAVLVVPELIYARSADGTEWATRIAEGPAPASSSGLWSELLARSAAAIGGPTGSTAAPTTAAPTTAPPSTAQPAITPLTSDRSFLDAVARAVGDIRHGELQKVVLSRQIELTFETAIDIPGLVRRWRDIEPTATVFSMPVGGAQFVGASPELLVSRSGADVHCRPLAGTSSRPGTGATGTDVTGTGATGTDVTGTDVTGTDVTGTDVTGTDMTGTDVTGTDMTGTGATGADRASAGPDDLRSSTKDNNEHRFVVEAIAEALAPQCTQLDVPVTPDLIHFHNVSHLGTSISGTLSGTTSDRPTVLELVATLHPTPAVGGVPRQRALRAITELEPDDRAHYAGPVGWIDAAGDGRWVVGIRAATIAGRHARLAAGVGIVERSDPLSELRETNWKFTAVLDALAPGHPTFPADARQPLRAMTVDPDQMEESPRRAG